MTELKKLNNILIPQISRLPEKDKKIQNNSTTEKADFEKVLDQTLANTTSPEISLSMHAEKRIRERNVNFDNKVFFYNCKIIWLYGLV